MKTSNMMADVEYKTTSTFNTVILIQPEKSVINYLLNNQ